MEKPNPEIKEGFKQLYKDLAENVSKSAFSSLFDEIQPKVFETFDEIILKSFKKELNEALQTRFEGMWSNGNVDMNLAALEIIKRQASSINEEEWRPSGKSVSEILRPYRMEVLKMKIAFYQEQLETIKPKLEESICEVENKRAELEVKLSNRCEHSDKINDMVYTIAKNDFGRFDC